ncbi:glutamate 5-kinase [Halothiobacillus diazotrophicus]|uniref:Glutamate 5-kinase n=2 Tax=Halothiobacillus diazotrophicus TaxID=1860122 RepID=A0A191ZHQ0_9GAMM|nr:glutamate 5-kinase [Halothiobacillus diazotrophicus]ANJ67382.1 glutamate 5-kinase [Halothiobacillus diazotrophicus]
MDGMMSRAHLSTDRRWVVKIGSAMVTGNGAGLDMAAIDRWAQQIAALRAAGREVVIVTSGAVAEGMARLGWQDRPTALPQLQAAAAVGQMGLVQAYADVLRRYDIHTAQILLTHEDLSDRERYLNARSTLRVLLGLGVVPVVNENDTVATDEIRFGDNDTLAALVANLVEADVLVILTDQLGLFDADPRRNPTAKLLTEVVAGDPALESMASPEGGRLGRGGMYTKVMAAKRAAQSGAATIVASGAEPEVLVRLASAEPGVGTLFQPAQTRLAARKQWLAGQLRAQGEVQVDAGAAAALRQGGRSLLPIGVIRVDGKFDRGDLVRIIDETGRDFARGLVNYSADQARKLCRQPSSAIADVLGFAEEDELIHRDNLVIL